VTQYAIRRALTIVPVLLGVSILVFSFVHMIPGDPALAMLGERATPEKVAEVRQRLGLDRPIYQQYVIYLGKVVQGDFGISIVRGDPVAKDLLRRFPATVELATSAILLALLFGIPIGIVSAVWRNSWMDSASRVWALVGVSMPIFWLGLIALVVFYARLGWAPSPGRLSATLGPPPMVTGFLLIDSLLAGRPAVARDALSHLLLPAAVLATYNLGIVTRLMRGSTLDVLGEDYVRTARAKGLAEGAVTLRHAARNALIPVITVIGLSFGRLLSGAVIIETVFAWPGLGSYAFRTATSLDFPAIMGVGIVVATIYVLANLLVDLAYALIDPRIQVGQ
jgi:peptide/nickel transport system permease protein